MCSMHVTITTAYKDNLLDESLVGANFGLLQGRNRRSNPCDEGELLSPTHLVSSLETDVRICPLVICKKQKKKNYYFNDPIVKIFMCSIAALNTIIRHIRSPHTCTLVSYLLKGQVAPRIPCRTLRARSSCPDRHLHKESRPCTVIKHQNDNANTHTHTHT